MATTSREFPRFVFPEQELGKLAWGASLSTAELSSALAVFRLLDFNLDGYVKLEDLRRAQVGEEDRAQLEKRGKGRGIVDPSPN